MVRFRHAMPAFAAVVIGLSTPNFASANSRAHMMRQPVRAGKQSPAIRDWTTCGFPNSLNAGGDGNIWFEVVDGCYNVSVGFITNTGNITVYPTNSDPFELTACARTRGATQTCSGRQRGAWLVNADPVFGGALLERVSEAGRIRTVPLSNFPTNAQFSQGVTLSNPATMWLSFSEPISQGSQGYVAAVVPQTGALTAYALPVANVIPNALTLGPDGNIWFVASNGYVGRVTSGGTIALFPSGATAPLAGITPGPDGNVWFTAGAQVGYATPTGAIHYLPLPVNEYGSDIAAGADGNMWITSGSDLIRLSLGGVATIFPIPDVGAFAREIVRGPKRTLWFNEINEPFSHIGEVQL